MSSAEITEERLIELVAKFIKTSDKVRGAIFSIISEIVPTKEDFKNFIAEMDKRFAELKEQSDKRFEAMDKRFEAMDKRFEAMDKRFEAMDKRFEEMKEENSMRFNELRSAIDNLGSRSGKGLERMILKLLKEQRALAIDEFASIERVTLVDTEGAIFAKGFRTDVDVVMKNGKTRLIEIKFRLRYSDLGHFYNIVKLYEKIYKKADELWALCLETDTETLQIAEQLSIKVIYGKLKNQEED